MFFYEPLTKITIFLFLFFLKMKPKTENVLQSGKDKPGETVRTTRWAILHNRFFFSPPPFFGNKIKTKERERKKRKEACCVPGVE